jgi:hypothetical protein
MAVMVSRTDDPKDHTEDPRLAELVEHVTERLPALIDAHVAYLLREIEVYRGDVISRDDLRRSVDHNMRYLVSALREPAEATDFTAPREAGRRRAHQGVPLPEVLRAYRTALTTLWSVLTERAQEIRDPRMVDTLISLAGQLWQRGDEYAAELAESYRATTTEMTVAQHQRRSALAEALFTGAPGPESAPWEVSRLLGLPPDGELAVVAAENPSTAAEGLPRVEALLAERGLVSAWRLSSVLQMGVVSLRGSQWDEMLDTLRGTARSRVGVSPVYSSLRDTPRALHLARVALAGGGAGQAEVTVFDPSPLAALVAHDMSEGKRIVRRVLGAVFELPAEDRVVLLDTLRVWFERAGSAEQAAEQLYCHPNTVRYRLRRLQELTGRSLSEPYEVADLAAALQALRFDRESGPTAH